MGKPTAIPVALLLILEMLLGQVSTFQSIGLVSRKWPLPAAPSRTSAVTAYDLQHVRRIAVPTTVVSRSKKGSEEDADNTAVSPDSDNFDGKGFAGYLAPYALAVLASIAVTAAFVKFVLLEY